MYLVYNSVLSLESDFRINADDRSFQYGDGLFETLRYQDGHLAFWADHYDRLTRGMAALRLNLPPAITNEALQSQVALVLARTNLTETTARIKLQVWRQPGGLYTPISRLANLLITAQAGHPFLISDKARIGIFEAVRLSPSPVSAYKTANALPYVLAGLAKQEGEFDDMILLDTNGHVAECIAAALFWFRDATLFLPALETGCIDGILRRQLGRLALAMGFTVQEGLFFPEELAQADAVYCGNVMGIQRLLEIDGIQLDPKKALAANLVQKINRLFSQLA